MANTTLFKDTPIDPVELSGVDTTSKSLTGKLLVQIQFDPLTNSTYRLYYRVDEQTTAPGATLATFLPEGFLTAGGDVEFRIDPDLEEDPYLHLLLTDASGTAANGGANDRVLFTAYRANAD
jgi:hypothetical protein